MENLKEEDIIKTLKLKSADSLKIIMKDYDYTFDENESTSRNIRNLAEHIYNVENKD